MFQSYQLVKYLGQDPKTKRRRLEYKIIDSDFEEVGVGIALGLAGVIIDIYEKKQLPVSINLALAFMYIHDQQEYDLKDLISCNRENNPKYLPYANEVEKQLERIMDMRSFW